MLGEEGNQHRRIRRQRIQRKAVLEIACAELHDSGRFRCQAIRLRQDFGQVHVYPHRRCEPDATPASQITEPAIVETKTVQRQSPPLRIVGILTIAAPQRMLGVDRPEH